MERAKKPFYKQVKYWVLFSVVALLVAFRILMIPLAKHFTQKGLDSMKGFKGSFSDIDISLPRLSYMIQDLKIIEEPVKKGKEPFFYAKEIDAHFEWRELIRFRVRATARLEDAKSTIVLSKQETPKERVAKEAGEKAKKGELPTATVNETLEKLIPFRLDRIEIKDGEVTIVDGTVEGRPKIWLHHIEATLENVATRRKLADKQPTTLAWKSGLQKSGKVTIFATADPFAKKLTFAGELRVEKLKLTDLHHYIVAKTGLKMPEGELEMFAAFKCVNGVITGGIKPMLKNAKVESAESGLGSKIKAALIDTALNIFSDRVPGRNAAATIIPIQGRIDKPDIQVWPTLLGVVRNAFVEGLAAGLDNLPPPTAEKKEGPLKQARRTLSKKASPPVKAQPEKK